MHSEKTYLTFTTLILCALLGMLSPCPAVNPAEPQLASPMEFLNHIERVLAGDNEEDPPPLNTKTAFLESLKQYKTSQASMSPQESAAKWVSFYDRFLNEFSSSDDPYMSYSSITAADLIMAIPAPEAWPHLRLAMQAFKESHTLTPKQQASIELFLSALSGDWEHLRRAIEILEADHIDLLTNSPSQVPEAYYQLLEIYSLKTQDASLLWEQYQRLLEAEMDKQQWTDTVEIPDLVSWVGEEQARGLIQALVLHPSMPCSWPEGSPTYRLAQSIARSQIESIKQPHWQLAADLKAMDLYLAFVRMSAGVSETTDKETSENPTEKPYHSFELILDSLEPFTNRSDKSEADFLYLTSLVFNDELDEAVQVYQKMKPQKNQYGFFHQWTWQTHLPLAQCQAIHRFLIRLLKDNPDLDLWSELDSTAPRANQTKETVDFALSLLKSDQIKMSTRLRLEEAILSLMLADGRIDEAFRIIEQNVNKLLDQAHHRESELSQLLEQSLIVHHISRIKQLDDWKATSGDWLITFAKRFGFQEDVTYRMEASDWWTIMDLLVDHQALELAQKIIAQQIASEVMESEGSFRMNRYWGMMSESSLIGENWVRFYHRHQAYQHALDYLQQSPHLGQSDLIENIRKLGQYGNDLSEQLALPLVVVDCLLHTGQTETAGNIADVYLNLATGYDPAYQFYIRTHSLDQCEQKFRHLLSINPFEERPLIWLATIQLQQNKLAEAAVSIKQAIQIDPSDGEQGKGDRLRVYEVYAKLEQSRGNLEAASLYRNVVRAIRLSENADDFHELGLKKEAIDQYRRSLEIFTDAYCIQSRLAEQLTGMGMHEEAEKHYRKAFELMPDSFGRVESHCFGCENTFGSSRAQSLAEEVFTKAIQDNPNKPQSHYLLAYLRQEQQRWEEMVPSLLKAVALDPDYLNAWKMLSSSEVHRLLNPEQQDDVIFNLIRLGHYKKHVDGEMGKVNQLTKLWELLEANQVKQEPLPETLYPFETSKAALESKHKYKEDAEERLLSASWIHNTDQDNPTDPRKGVLVHQLIQLFITLHHEGRRFFW